MKSIKKIQPMCLIIESTEKETWGLRKKKLLRALDLLGCRSLHYSKGKKAQVLRELLAQFSVNSEVPHTATWPKTCC